MKSLVLYLLILLLPACLYAQDTTYQDPVQQEEYTDDSAGYSEDGEYTEDDSEESGEEHVVLKPSETSSTKAYQSEEIYHKTFDENKWRKIIGEQDYKEGPLEPEKPPKMNLPGFSWGGDVLKAVAYTFVVALILLILYLVIKNIKIDPKKKYTTVAPFQHHDEDDIREMDLPAMLKQALADRNFKLAVRLYYLTLLRNLHDAGKIQWEKDKTNRDYLSELFTKEYYYDEVRKLTRSYEEVWYGDHYFPEQALLSLIANFESIHSRINPTKSL